MRFPLRLRSVLPFLSLLALLGTTMAAYSPGLSGPFLLDDWSTLPKLGAYGPVDNPTTFVSYVTDGIAGPTGRPLALASFLMDADHWPAHPWPFKLTNVLLHLLNGVVLALLLRLLSRASGLGPRKAAWVGVLGAGLWLMHPLFVSTTLYVVQRMAELSALFVLAGLSIYTLGRSRLDEGRPRSGYLLMVGGLVIGTCIGALAKENAALTPLLAYVLELTIFARMGPSRSGTRSHASAPGRDEPPAAHRAARNWLVFRAIFLWLPSLAILAYLAWLLRHATAPLPNRDFTIGQRLLTEGRVLVRYLYLLVIPHGGTGGLYTTVAVSRTPFTPWTTLPAIALITALVSAALAMRRRWPVVAAAVLFFFAGQLLESTTVPLELYFEHRNYLPAALLFWPVAWWVVRGTKHYRLRIGVVAALLLVFPALTAYRASLWGNGTTLALTWLRLDPASPRAIVSGAQALTAAGRPGRALALLRRSSQARPDNISIGLSRLVLACETGRARQTDLAAARRAAANARVGSRLIYKAVGRLAGNMDYRRCPAFSIAELQSIPAAALRNRHFAHHPVLRQDFLVLSGKLLLDEGNAGRAYAKFAKALKEYPKPDTALVTAAQLYAAHAPGLGLKLLDEYRRLPKPSRRGWTMKRLHHWWLNRIGWYRESFQRVRTTLEHEAGRTPEKEQQ